MSIAFLRKFNQQPILNEYRVFVLNIFPTAHTGRIKRHIPKFIIDIQKVEGAKKNTPPNM